MRAPVARCASPPQFASRRMDTPSPDAQGRLVAEIDEWRRALLKLRMQMMQLHARLEYQRLMLRLSPRDRQP